jgi:hypothetical protein
MDLIGGLERSERDVVFGFVIVSRPRTFGAYQSPEDFQVEKWTH